MSLLEPQTFDKASSCGDYCSCVLFNGMSLLIMLLCVIAYHMFMLL